MSYEETRQVYLNGVGANYKKIDEFLDKVGIYYEIRNQDSFVGDSIKGRHNKIIIEFYEGELKSCVQAIGDLESSISWVDSKILGERK